MSDSKVIEKQDNLQTYEDFAIGDIVYHIQLPELRGKQSYFDQFRTYCEENVDEPDKVDYFYCLIVRRYREKKYDVASSYVNRAIKIYPDDAGLYFLSALILKERKKYNKAIDMLAIARELDSGECNITPLASTLVGILTGIIGNHEECFRILKKAWALYDERTVLLGLPYGVLELTYLSMLGELSNDDEVYIEYISKALDLSDEVTDEFNIVRHFGHGAIALKYYYRNDYERALYHFEKVLEYQLKPPEDPAGDQQKESIDVQEDLVEMAICYEKVGDYEKAGKYYREALKQFETMEGAHRYAISTSYINPQIPECELLLEKAEEMNLDYPILRRYTEYLRKRFDDAHQPGNGETEEEENTTLRKAYESWWDFFSKLNVSCDPEKVSQFFEMYK